MVVVEEISKKYGENLVLDHVSFTVKKGQTLAILGESGCGKTTLLRIIAGLEKSDSGNVWIEGCRMSEKIEPCKRNLAMVFQDATLWNHMTVKKNITFAMKEKDNEKIQKLSEAFGVSDLFDRYPEEISGGQAKRISLVRALVSDRKLLLLDEPLSNIDKETKMKVLTYIKNHVCGEKAVVYVTHDEGEVSYLDCDVMRL